MNDKDLSKLTLGIEPDANDVMIFRPHPSGDGRALLNKSVKPEFLQCLVHYLFTKTNGCAKPITLTRSDGITFVISMVPEEETKEEVKPLIHIPK